MGWLDGLRQLLAPQKAKRTEAENEERFSEWIRIEVGCGYGKEADLLAELDAQLRYEIPGITEAEIARWLQQMASALEKQRTREEGWGDLTHNDRIDRAFDDLRAIGIVALQDAGYTMSDGCDDAANAFEQDPDLRGWTFFHRQDVERGVAGEGLLLAFGSFDTGPEHAGASLAVADEVRAVLARHGVGTTRGGNLDERIHIEPFEWRKRRWTSAPRP